MRNFLCFFVRRGKRKQFEFKKEEDDFFSGIEKRKTARIFPPLTLRFLIFFPHKMEEISALIKDISLEGARIETEERLPKGSVISAQIYSSQLEPIEVIALVVREREKAQQRSGKIFYEVGIQFIEMDEESRKRLREYLLSCLS